MNLDISIFRALNDLAGQSALSDAIFIFMAEYLPYLVILMIVILFVVWKKSWTHKLQLLFISAIFWVVAYAIIYFVFHPIWPRIRPFEFLLNVNQLIGEGGFSFPSQHATLFFLLATIIFWVRPRIGFWFLAMSFFIALGRVLVGVHYPLDVAVGAIFGVVMGISAMFLAKKFNLIKI